MSGKTKSKTKSSGFTFTRVISLRSQVVYSKQPKLGLAQEFAVLLVRMR